MLTPARRRGVEILDDASVDPAVRRRSHADIASSNRWLGGLRAAMGEVRGAARGLASATLLDVGTGLADIPAGVRDAAARTGTAITIFGVDEAPTLLAASRERLDGAVCASALALPFRDGSIDIVLCSQLLHHFENTHAEQLLREMNRVAGRAVIVSDLRRSWFAAAGFWLVAVALRFHRVTRHDGVVSVLRGFTAPELARLVRNATGAEARVRRKLGYRLTARWAPGA